MHTILDVNAERIENKNNHDHFHSRILVGLHLCISSSDVLNITSMVYLHYKTILMNIIKPIYVMNLPICTIIFLHYHSCFFVILMSDIRKLSQCYLRQLKHILQTNLKTILNAHNWKEPNNRVGIAMGIA